MAICEICAGTGRLPDHIKSHKGFAKRVPAEFGGAYDFAPVNEGLAAAIPGTYMKATDIDACVEVEGKFLFIETKTPGAVMPTPQKHMYAELYKQVDATIITVNGMQDAVNVVISIRPSEGFFAYVENVRGEWFNTSDHEIQKELTRAQYVALIAKWVYYAGSDNNV